MTTGMVAAPGCARDGDRTAADTGSILVATASSLNGAFSEIGAAFEGLHRDASVKLNVGGSSALATQAIEGAPVDVFVSADEASMTRMTDAGLVVGRPRVLARNALAIVTKPGNPAKIHSLADLRAVGVVALCATEVPCGRYAQKALGRAGVTLRESSVTRSPSASATLAAVRDGDAEAGVVYMTDATSTTDVAALEIPARDNVVVRYRIARLTRAWASALAAAFVEFVLSASGQRVLQSFGFLPAV